MKPEKNKKCPFCGGDLKQRKVEVFVNQLASSQIHRGLIMQAKPVFSLRCGYWCESCQAQLSIKQLSGLTNKEVSVHYCASG